MYLIPSDKVGSKLLNFGETSGLLPLGPEFSITVKPLRGEGLMEIFSRLATALADTDTALVNLIVFGPVNVFPAADEAMRRVFGAIDWPVTWVEGAPDDGQIISGIQAFAFSAGQVHPITAHGKTVGCVFEEDGLRHCLLGGLGPNLRATDRSDEFRQTMTNLEHALASAGFAMGDIVRTWFYLDDLLSWYGDFNRARTEVYSKIQFRTGSLPASTGISGTNPSGSSLVVGAWAMQPVDPSTRIMEVPSPLQCPAPAYGSSFSRAMEISTPRGRRLLISGTASIEPGGKTIWPDSAEKQIELTMEVVEVILASRGFGFPDVTRATAYFKNIADAAKFEEWQSRYCLRTLPVINTQCGICRDDLLFELEADAWASSPAPDPHSKAL
jgi:enamine deaminase RidA (YjgF/YER057c/UK114 family)